MDHRIAVHDFELLKEYIEGAWSAQDFRDILESDESLCERVRVLYAEARSSDEDIVSRILNADRENPCLADYYDGIVTTVLDHAGIPYVKAERKKTSVKQLERYESKKTGKSQDRRLSLPKNEVKRLFAFLEKRLQTEQCKHGFDIATEFLSERGYDAQAVCAEFRDLGAFCDCEIPLNLDEFTN